jgi:hypothetical protein
MQVGLLTGPTTLKGFYLALEDDENAGVIVTREYRKPTS